VVRAIIEMEKTKTSFGWPNEVGKSAVVQVCYMFRRPGAGA
jgi:hypothetical protein